MAGKGETRSVVITGARGGIGGAAATLFHARGWRVLAVDIHEPDQAPPEGLTFLQTDIAQAGAAEALADEAASYLDGKLDALVNNAAIQITKPIQGASAEEWDQLLAVNLRAPFLLTQALYPRLKAAEGAVVNVSSVHAFKTAPDMAIYAASKGGLLGLTQQMALDFAEDGVRANAILPGATETGMLLSGMVRDRLEGGDVIERLKLLGDKVPMGRVLRPDEIAEAIYFLADGRQSSAITGIPLIVDGGALALEAS